MKLTFLTNVVTVALCGVSLYGCGWVDSTGIQSAPPQIDSGTIVSTEELQTSVIMLRENEPAAFLENTANLTLLEDADSQIADWVWTISDEGNNQRCESLDSFDRRFAATTLAQACSDSADCEIGIEPSREGPETGFIISLPKLQAPIAVTYQLLAQSEDGQPIERTQSVCALSINEAPDAVDDRYRAIAGVPLIVSADDENNLLANDQDDVDARNEPLLVNTSVVRAPKYAVRFSLQSDGGFTYQASTIIPADADGLFSDSFVYSISDGLHEINATATINISAGNREPMTVGSLPDAFLTLPPSMTTAVYQIDVSSYFTDADNDLLTYSIAQTFPEGLTAAIDDTGLLTITAGSDDNLVGTWPVRISASDGLSDASTVAVLSIEAAAAEANRPPTVSGIDDRFVQNTFSYDVGAFFTDPDGDRITFSSQSLPPSVRLSASGVLSGRQTRQNSGSWFIVIVATDIAGESVSDGFWLVIN